MRLKYLITNLKCVEARGINYNCPSPQSQNLSANENYLLYRRRSRAQFMLMKKKKKRRDLKSHDALQWCLHHWMIVYVPLSARWYFPEFHLRWILGNMKSVMGVDWDLWLRSLTVAVDMQKLTRQQICVVLSFSASLINTSEYTVQLSFIPYLSSKTK